MPCPYFFPVERFEDKTWIQPPRLPLGSPFRGVCRANEADPVQPGDRTLRALCNLGYARGACPRFPSLAEADAVRFSISGDREGIVSLQYIMERDYSPVRFGPAEYNVADATFISGDLDELTARQARVFIESYLRRKATA